MHLLLEYLRSIPKGQIAEVGPLEGLLASFWEEFDGASAEGMEAYKLHRRMENVCWDPPILSFRIERHGATVQGSTRAELQSGE